MRNAYSLGLLASLLFVTGEARPCGGAFGSSYTIAPAQKIIVSYRDGVETYVFNPNFCGKADSFGLILPVPSTLTAIPKLGTQQLYTDLATVAAPTVVTTYQCQMKGGTGGSSSWGAAGASNSGGTTVVQRGQVGIFDWALLQATDVSSFTEWLTTNGFPYPSSAVATFQAYVDNGWYFVAFKVSTGANSGTAGAGTGGAATAGATNTSTVTICGSFGPVTLSFATAPNPVVPARIASVSSTSLSWDIFAIGATQMRMQGYSPTLQFSGAISEADLTSHPALAQVAKSGDRLTELLLSSLPASDLILEADPNQADYRRVVNQVQYLSVCTGGAGTGGNQSKGGSAGVDSAGGSAGKAMTGGAATGGAASGGTASGGAASGGTATGGTATVGVATGGLPGSGGKVSTGGIPASGGGILNRNGGATSVETAQAGAVVVVSEPNANSGCDCSTTTLGGRSAARGFGLVGLLGIGVALTRRRRLTHHC